MEDNRTSTGKGPGIAGLILGILAVIISRVPCIGILPIIIGVFAIILSSAAFYLATKMNSSKVVITLALVISGIGIICGVLNGVLCGTVSKETRQMETAIDKEASAQILKMGDDIEKMLDDLDNKLDSNQIKIDTKQPITNDDFNEFITDYEKLLSMTIDLKHKSESGNINAVGAYTRVSLKLSGFISKLAVMTSKLTNEQKKQIEELHRKYENDLDELKKK